jgi:hypothetical protein
MQLLLPPCDYRLLQEQEQEQEVEMEVQKEESRVEAAAAKQDYSREDEAIHPFKLRDLSQAPQTGKQGFYPCSEFGIKAWRGAANKLSFPSFMLASRNYYNLAWSLRSLRRLKNVIAIVEWVPDLEKLGPSTEIRELSKAAEAELGSIFQMYDLDKVCVNSQIDLLVD